MECFTSTEIAVWYFALSKNEF